MVKSFELDHEVLYAPYIRLADEKISTYDEVTVYKFDLRFAIPNVSIIDDKIMHSMEHLLATSFDKEFTQDLIDISPMGCKTGFYVSIFMTHDIYERITKAISDAATIETPSPTAKNCGSFTMHNMDGAREALRKISKLLDFIME